MNGTVRAFFHQGRHSFANEPATVTTLSRLYNTRPQGNQPVLWWQVNGGDRLTGTGLIQESDLYSLLVKALSVLQSMDP